MTKGTIINLGDETGEKIREKIFIRIFEVSIQRR